MTIQSAPARPVSTRAEPDRPADAHRRFRFVAPAGSPVTIADLAAWLKTQASGDPRAALAARLSAMAGVSHCALTGTGRAGLTVLLASLRDLRPGPWDEVIVPAYTCFSVAASVVKAGLTPRIVDVAPRTLDFDYAALERVDTRRALAIVGTNLYGMPNDMPRLQQFARSRQLFLVDDAAQAFGARVGGRLSGTWGDAGLYSFDKGKNVSAIDGGVIVTSRADIGDRVVKAVSVLPSSTWGASAVRLAKLAVYAACLRPSLYWIPNGIPQLGLGVTVYTTAFPLERYSRSLAALALTMARHSDRFAAIRRANAANLREQLAGERGLTMIEPVAGSEPAYLRFPVLAADRETRDRALDALQRAGIGATGSYPSPLSDIPDVRRLGRGPYRDAAGAAAVADRIITLPTHPYVSARDRDCMVAVLGAVTR